MVELREEVQDCKKDWEGSKAKMRREAEEWLERERKKWKEDARVQIEGFKEICWKVLRMVQDKEEEIKRLKEKVSSSWDEGMENTTKEMWFGMKKEGRLQTLRNVMRLMEYYFELQHT